MLNGLGNLALYAWCAETDEKDVVRSISVVSLIRSWHAAPPTIIYFGLPTVKRMYSEIRYFNIGFHVNGV